ncbi:hypothetical protein O0L34_g14677 [Tuta absoluta]|nr:hypothetical protein O0L34_g14677 [Tuta absoluta]
MNKLTTYTIKEIHKAYRDKLLTPTSFVDLCLQKAKQTGELNAFVTLTEDIAENYGIESEKRFYIDKKTKPLDGITIGIKDNFCTKNTRTTCASKMLENFVPTYDASVYAKLRDAGACLIGKTNLDEFAMGAGTIDSIFGPTKNPWGYENGKDNFRIAGGSSGGSAVAVSSGACVAAIGSDTGGSTRNPAALCGVVGLKPTYGLVSRYGLIPLVNSMDVPGILTRTVEDAAAIFNCIAGPDHLDSTTIKKDFKPFTLREDFDLGKVKIGIPKEYYCEGMSAEVLDTWRYVTDLLENEKAIVKTVSLPNTSVSIAVYSILNQCEVASNMARYDGLEYGLRTKEDCSTEELYASSRSQGFNNVVRSRIFSGNYFLLRQNYDKYFIKALKLRRLISDDFKKVFSGEDSVDLLLTPTTLSDAPTFEEFSSKHNRDQCAFQDYCTQPANMAGIPAISIPIRLSKNKLPLSLQLMGPNLSEELLLNVAKKIETTLTTETLSQLNVSIDALPQRCQQLLHQYSCLQAALDIEQFDPVAVSLRQTRQTAELMEAEYELLELRQRNAELLIQVDRNRRNIQGLERELQSSKESLANQEPNPDNIHEQIRQMKQKLDTYEDIYEKAKAKFGKLHVPEAIMPKSIEELASRLASLKHEEESLKMRAEDITLARQARDTLSKLRRV